MKQPNKLSIWAAMLAVYIAWGSTYLAIRFAVETMPPFLMAAVRFLIAGALLYVWQRFQGNPAPRRIEWRSAVIVGGLLLVGGNGGVVWAEQRVPSGIAALLVGSSPLWMALVDFLRPRSGVRPSWITLLGVLVGLAGIGLLASPGGMTGLGGQVDLTGIEVLTLAAFLWAMGSLYSRSAPLPSAPLLGTGMEMLCGGAGLLLLGSLLGEWNQVHLAAITTRSLLGLLYLIVFGSLVGFACYTWLLRSAPTPLVSTYAYVNPLVAIFIGSLLGNEALTPRVLLAAAVIISAVILITLARARQGRIARLAEPVTATGDD